MSEFSPVGMLPTGFFISHHAIPGLAAGGKGEVMDRNEKQARLIYRLLAEARKAAAIAEEVIEEPSGTIADLDDQEYSAAYALMRYAEGQVWAIEWMAGLGSDMTFNEEAEAIHYLVNQEEEKNRDRLAMGTTEASAQLELLACLDGYDPERPHGGTTPSSAGTNTGIIAA
jgi:hypothetical protein